MQTTFIWDLDGTLVDSYGSILGHLLDLYHEFGYDPDPKKVHKIIIDGSVRSYTDAMDKVTPLPYAEMRKRYTLLQEQRKAAGLPVKTYDIPAIPLVKEALDLLRQKGAQHMIYTHRDKGTFDILDNLGLTDFFTDIITAELALPRKPAPDGVLYLMEKHVLAPAATYYVGDRTIDMDCAKAAGIPGILYLPQDSYCEPNGAESFIVSELPQIGDLPIF